MSAVDNLNGQQMQLFDPGPAAPMYGPTRADVVAAPHDAFSGRDEHSRVISQRSLPNAIPVRHQMGQGAAMRSKFRKDEHMEVPYNQLSTEQWGVRIDRVNQVWRGEKLPSDGYATQRPLAREYRHPTDPTQNHYTILDGNHRATVERHKGAMFLPVMVNRSNDISDMPPLSRFNLRDHPGSFNL
jgi:hypothetical protein